MQTVKGWQESVGGTARTQWFMQVRLQGWISRHHWAQTLRYHHRMLTPSIHATIPFTGSALKQALPKCSKRQLIVALGMQTISLAILAERECAFA